ncbi:helix-turn-helix transcriptional regulator [Thiotrichales bacterium 19S3-7]|nr:helix-turn-helix transcriptional regulator [Thiotrichales bacterium 19S3-7]MCF6802872.1 helix-turn-helix transcriptional regulator [Thiotrichales bacterium 19S3-11]
MNDLLQQLNDQLYLLRQALDLLPGYLYAKDMNGYYIFYNKNYIHKLKEQSLIAEGDQVIGKSDYDLFDVATAKQFRDNDLKVIKEKSTFQDEEIIIMKPSTKRRYLSTKKPLYDQNNQIAGLIGYSIEFTDIDIGMTSICLSQREIESLALLYFGHTIKQIAKKLKLSPCTIEDYINNVKLKFKTDNKVDIISIIRKNNLDQVMQYYLKRINDSD